LIENDKSISREHAVFTITPASDEELSDFKTTSTLLLKDTSKYGTTVNGLQIKSETIIKEGDKITFGVYGSNFT
jgi:pSer/pThr/pTyr-binding forkhead associated (FHA) protein